MKRDQILQLIKDLARSQGSYGRMLRSIEEMDFDTKEKMWELFEAQEFKDPVDFVLFI